MKKYYIAAGAVTAVAAFALIGQGCISKKSTNTKTPEQNSKNSPGEIMNNLHTPGPAIPPTEDPVIPPEAAKVPRPY